MEDKHIKKLKEIGIHNIKSFEELQKYLQELLKKYPFAYYILKKHE